MADLSLAAQLDHLVDAGAAGRPMDVPALLTGLGEADLAAAEGHAREALVALPTPLFPHIESPLARRRSALRRVAAHASDLLGRPDELLDILRNDWLRGASVMPLLRTMRAHDRGDEANVTARLALMSAEGREEEEIEDFLSSSGAPPDGWTDAVRAFARRPSREGWESLLQFTPPEVYYHRVRSTLRLLRRLGVEPDVVFDLATYDAVTPDAIELAESGLVSVGRILARMAEGTPESRPLWLGLAARAAFEQGDRFGTVRFLSEAYQVGDEPFFLPTIQTMDIREQADDELHEMLDRGGVPRFDDD